MNEASSSGIAWLGDAGDGGELSTGEWGTAATLAVPLNDRGLLLADGLFETILVQGGQPQLLAEHLQRWRQGSALLGLAPPPQQGQLEPLIAAAIARSGIGNGALRLSWSRGTALQGSGRGIEIPERSQHRCWLQLQPHQLSFTPVQVHISPTEIRSASSLLSRCKSLGYGAAIQAKRQAQANGADDALLASSAGGLCCGSTANLLVQRDGLWLTPPESSGCLPGVMRGRALALGLAREANAGELDAAAVTGSSGALLLNSLGCRPIASLDGRAVAWPAAAEPGATPPATRAEELFARLLTTNAS